MSGYGQIQDLSLGRQVERKNRGAADAESIMGWSVGGEGLLSSPLGERSGETAVTDFFVIFFGRILVHAPAHMSVCFCTVIRPGPALQYACL